ncbi:MAG: response regulator [Haloarculaceae archaeon]
MCATPEKEGSRGIPEAEDGSTEVLVVDDEREIASLVAQYLHRLDGDLTVHVEVDPADALDALEREPVDCVVSDYDMPRMDGLSLLGAVRERKGGIPFVLFTGAGDEQVASRARQRDARYVRKRGTDGFDRLLSSVAEALDGVEN